MVDLIGRDLKTKANGKGFMLKNQLRKNISFYPTIIDFQSRVIKKWVLPWKAKCLKIKVDVEIEIMYMT